MRRRRRRRRRRRTQQVSSSGSGVITRMGERENLLMFTKTGVKVVLKFKWEA
jgi:hypothetical protein